MQPDRRSLASLVDMYRMTQQIKDEMADISLDQYHANLNLRLAIERRLEIL